MPSPHDVVCICGHWYQEHGPEGSACGACSCPRFEHSPDQTRVALTEPRGGLRVVQRSPEVAELRRRRKGAMDELRRAEWQFDKRPTVANATACSVLRSSISAVEMLIASVGDEDE